MRTPICIAAGRPVLAVTTPARGQTASAPSLQRLRLPAACSA